MEVGYLIICSLSVILNFVLGYKIYQDRARQNRIVTEKSYYKLSLEQARAIVPYGPFIEGCAGNSENAFIIRQMGGDVIAFDHENYSTVCGDVRKGLSGTFEHLYPDRTLLLFLGANAKKAVSNYTGNKVIIGGYCFNSYKLAPDVDVTDRVLTPKDFQLAGRKYDTRPSDKWMLKNGWRMINFSQPGSDITIGNNNPDYVIRVFERGETRIEDLLRFF